MSAEVSICLECLEKMQGRIDKKFCSDSCRNAYHNKKRQPRSASVKMKRVNVTLARNRAILGEIATNPRRHKTASTFNLLLRGFDFSFYTHQMVDPKGKVIYFCYDIGYQFLNDSKIRILNNRNYSYQL